VRSRRFTLGLLVGLSSRVWGFDVELAALVPARGLFEHRYQGVLTWRDHYRLVNLVFSIGLFLGFLVDLLFGSQIG
jgi:hypothetical protein